MTKTQIFKNMHLHYVAIKELDNYLTSTIFLNNPHSTNFEITKPGSVHWCLDTFDQFIAEYAESVEALYQRAAGAYEVHIFNSFNRREFFSEITVRAPFRQTIDTVFDFIAAYRKASTKLLESPPTAKPTKTASPKTSRRDRKRPCRTHEMSRPR